jgi:transcriptional regulator with XRE-family HTH domain
MPYDRSDLADRARILVEKSGLSLREIDRRIERILGAKEGSVLSWTSRLLHGGYRKPDLTRLSAFAEVMGVPPGELLGDEDGAPTSGVQVGAAFRRKARQFAPGEPFERAYKALPLVRIPREYEPSGAIAVKVLRVLSDALERADELVERDQQVSLPSPAATVPPPMRSVQVRRQSVGSGAHRLRLRSS